MTIRTKSVFYYVNEITEENYALNFIEPNQDNVELLAELDIGGYSISDLLLELEGKLNQVGKAEYTVNFNRNTRIVTISADDDFDILPIGGSNSGVSAWPTLGFSIDQTGGDSYNSNNPIGVEYLPQYFLQEYLDKNDNLEGVQTSLNESASGISEVVTFGQLRFYEFNIKWIKNLEKTNSSFLDINPNAVQDARNFLEFCIKKNNLEYMPDINDRSFFDKILLDSTPSQRDGTGFRLRELTNQGLDGYYETGRLKFRVL